MSRFAYASVICDKGAAWACKNMGLYAGRGAMKSLPDRRSPEQSHAARRVLCADRHNGSAARIGGGFGVLWSVPEVGLRGPATAPCARVIAYPASISKVASPRRQSELLSYYN